MRKELALRKSLLLWFLLLLSKVLLELLRPETVSQHLGIVLSILAPFQDLDSSHAAGVVVLGGSNHLGEQRRLRGQHHNLIITRVRSVRA